MDQYLFAFAIANVVLWAVYFKSSWNGDRQRAFAPVFASLAIGAFVMIIANFITDLFSILALLGLAALFAMIPFYYGRSKALLAVFLLFGIIEFFYFANFYGAIFYLTIQAFAIGTAFGVVSRTTLKPVHGKNKSIETRRDLVHVFLGTVILALFLLLGFSFAVYLTMVLIFAGYFINSFVSRGKKGISGIFFALERPDELYGLGALYLAIGVSLLLGFVHTLGFMIIGIVALLLADPIATIVGMNLKGKKLRYNKGKTVFGALAFFFVVALLCYPFVGLYSVVFGAALAFVESYFTQVDDNISIPAATAILYFLSFLL